MDKKISTVLIIFCFFYCLTSCSDAQEQKQASVTTGLMKGQLAPDFTLKDINGKEVSLSSFRDKSMVCLVFWATWCPYCIKEIPKLKEIYTKFNEKGVAVISVNIAANDPIKRVVAFQQKNEIPYNILYDEKSDVSKLYGITGIPVSIIIDKKGVIRYGGYTLPEIVTIEQMFAKYL